MCESKLSPVESYYFVSAQLNMHLLATRETFENSSKNVMACPFELSKKAVMARTTQLISEKLKTSVIISGSW